MKQLTAAKPLGVDSKQHMKASSYETHGSLCDKLISEQYVPESLVHLQPFSERDTNLPSKMGYAVTLLTFILEIPSSKLGWNTHLS
jgi:hypothetical protein